MILRGHELYVRVGDSPTAVDRLRDAVGEAADIHHSPGSAYCVVLWPDETFRPPEELSRSLSRDLATEVVWLAWQKQVDAFAFQRWVDGKSVRRLAYGMMERERTWEVVDGTPEPWEADAFFDPARLERQLRVRKLFPGRDEITEEELRRVWEQRLLVVDSEHPQLAAIDAAYTVARHFRLPGWSA
jgi:hypothetical protein